MTPSVKALQQIFKLTTTAMFPALLKVTYVIDGVTNYLRLVNNTVDMIFGGETYKAFCFEYQPPKQSDSRMGNGSLSLSCIDQEVIEIIRAITDRAHAEIVAAFYFSEDGTTYFEGIEDWNFELSSVTWDGTVATWQMIYDERMDNIVPTAKMSAQRCPGVA